MASEEEKGILPWLARVRRSLVVSAFAQQASRLPDRFWWFRASCLHYVTYVEPSRTLFFLCSWRTIITMKKEELRSVWLADKHNFTLNEYKTRKTITWAFKIIIFTFARNLQYSIKKTYCLKKNQKVFLCEAIFYEMSW